MNPPLAQSPATKLAKQAEASEGKLTCMQSLFSAIDSHDRIQVNFAIPVFG